MHYANVLGEFNNDFDAYILIKKQTSPEVPLVNDKDKDKKIIKCVPLFEDALLYTFRRKEPLVYIVQYNANIPDVEDDPLTANAHCVASRFTLEELINHLPHVGPIFVYKIRLSS